MAANCLHSSSPPREGASCSPPREGASCSPPREGASCCGRRETNVDETGRGVGGEGGRPSIRFSFCDWHECM